MTYHSSLKDANREIEDLKARLQEAEDGIRAIQNGEVDAVVVSGPQGEQVYTLTGAEHAYRVLVEAMSEGALVLSPDGVILFSNRTFAAMLGKSVIDVFGHVIYDFVTEQDIPHLRKMLDSLPVNASRREIGLLLEDETHLPAFISVGPLESSLEGSILAVVTDLSQHKRTEAELAQYREHLEELVVERTKRLMETNQSLIEFEQKIKNILDSITDGFMAFDNDWRFIYINPEAERQMLLVYGKNRQQLLGKKATDEIINFSKRESFNHYRRAIDEQLPVTFEEYFPESNIWLQYRLFASEAGLSVYSEDITERKRVEKQMLRQNTLVEAINSVFHKALTCDTEHELGHTCIEVAQDLTASFFGIISEIDAQGKLVHVAVSDSLLSADHTHPDADLVSFLINSTYLRLIQVQQEQNGFYLNGSLSSEPGWSSRFSSVMVVPLTLGVRIVGLLTVAKQDSEYIQDELELLQDFAPAIVESFLRKRTEGALREREEHLRLFIEHAPVALALFDDQMQYMAASHRWIDDYGLDSIDIVGKSHYEILPEIPDEWKAIHQRCLCGESISIDEAPFVRADGSTQWLRWEILPWKRADNTIGGIIIFTEDITRRKLLEDTEMFLLQSGWAISDEQFFESLVLHIYDMFNFDIVCVGKFSNGNRQLNTIALSCKGKIHPNINYELAGGPCFEYTQSNVCTYTRDAHLLFPKDPMVRSIGAESFIGIPLRNSAGIPIGLIFVADRDHIDDTGLVESILNLVAIRAVGEIERQEDAAIIIQARSDAQQQAAKLESFVSNLSDGVVMIDADDNIAWINDAGKEILRIPPDEEPAKWITQCQGEFFGERTRASDKLLGFCTLHGDKITDERYKIKIPSGDTIVLSVSVTPVVDSQGNVIGTTSTFRDQTDRVAFEDEKQRLLERERNIAEALQGALVPKEVPSSMYGCSLAVEYRSALREAEVGGDFMDIFDLGDGRLGILIGDVAGKGLKAAIRVAEARYSIRSYAHEDGDPASVLTRANNVLCKNRFDEGSMLTAVFAVVDSNSKQVIYANAGHEPPVILRPDTTWEEFQTSGIPLGIISGVDYIKYTCDLNEHDRVVMITDGISEARAMGNVLYEKSSVINYLLYHVSEPLHNLISGLLAAATEHAGGQLQDDAALVVFEYSGNTT